MRKERRREAAEIWQRSDRVRVGAACTIRQRSVHNGMAARMQGQRCGGPLKRAGYILKEETQKGRGTPNHQTRPTRILTPSRAHAYASGHTT